MPEITITFLEMKSPKDLMGKDKPQGLDIMEAEDRNVITKCMGIISGKYLDGSRPSNSSKRLRPEDRIVLASDGLWDVLTTDEVAKIVYKAGSTQEAVIKLREEVRKLVHQDPSSDDNINIIVYEHA